MQIGTSGLRDKGMKRSSLLVRKIKVTWPNLDLKAWWSHHFRPIRLSGFSSYRF